MPYSPGNHCQLSGVERISYLSVRLKSELRHPRDELPKCPTTIAENRDSCERELVTNGTVTCSEREVEERAPVADRCNNGSNPRTVLRGA